MDKFTFNSNENQLKMYFATSFIYPLQHKVYLKMQFKENR